MNRLDRLFGILLLLSGGRPVSAADLARRFEVSRRTIYRDVEALSALGVPVFARRGYEGGLQLLEGYFLPPLMFTTEEAVSLLLGLTLLHSLSAPPFPAALEAAEHKLLAAVPARLQHTLARARAIVGFETQAADIFHPEPTAPPVPGPTLPANQVVSDFLQALLDRRAVAVRYHSPYQPAAAEVEIEPQGLYWDRDRWYLAGRRLGRRERPRLWRADRVRALQPTRPLEAADGTFDVRELLGRRWLQAAMQAWAREAPVKIRLTQNQADRLQQDWYYRHAHFERLPEGGVLMTLGEDDQAAVLDLLRWLGPGAELLEPRAWRQALRAELEQMLRTYAEA